MQVTNRMLLQLHQQRNDLTQQQPLLAILLGSKLRQFDNSNGIRIHSLIKKLNKIENEYFVHENDRVKYEGEQGKEQPVLLEGKTREDFDKTINQILDKEIQIIV